MAHILIVDDDEIVADLASQSLIAHGHACGWVSGGQEAIDLLAWRRPDLILLDQDMPEMTGQQVVRKLRASPEFYDLPIVMFTGISGQRDEERALYHGAQAYIRKPFDPDLMVHIIEGVLDKRAQRPSHTDLREWLERSAGIYNEENDRQPLRRAI